MTQKAFAGRALSGAVMAAPLLLALMAGTATAQQAYYYPQAGNSPVTVNYGALTPYGAPGYQPYGAPAYTQPRSVFTPQAAAPAYAAPAYSTPSSQFLPGQVTGGPAYSRPAYPNPAYGPITYTASPVQPPFVAPYANPAFGSQVAGLPNSTPESYLNVPGQAPVALYGTPQPGAKPFDPNSLKRKKARAAAPAPTSEPSAVEEAAAAQVAAVEEQLESGAAPAAPLPEPTPPPAPAEIPASVPSPVQEAAVAPAAPAAEPAPAEAAPAEPAAEAAPAEPTTDSAAVEPTAPVEETPAEEAPADTGGAAALPGGATRIVFEGDADELPAGASAELDAIAQRMAADESIKVQVLAYSSSVGDNESQARRKALSRGLEVRKYLIGKGVRSNRIDVRALGSKSEGSPADRVDIVPAAG